MAATLTHRRGVIACICLCAYSVGLFQVLFPAAIACAQSSNAESVLNEGRRAFDRARFSEAIEILEKPVGERAFAGRDLLEAREILARSYIKVGDSASAVRYFRDNLKQNPDYRPNSDIVPPDEMEVFERARPQTTKDEIGRPWWKKWYVIGGGAAVIGGIAYLILGDGGDGGEEGSLPLPPDPPTAPRNSGARLSTTPIGVRP